MEEKKKKRKRIRQSALNVLGASVEFGFLVTDFPSIALL